MFIITSLICSIVFFHHNIVCEQTAQAYCTQHEYKLAHQATYEPHATLHEYVLHSQTPSGKYVITAHCIPPAAHHYNQSKDITVVSTQLDDQIQSLPTDCIAWHSTLEARRAAVINHHQECTVCSYTLSAHAHDLCNALKLSTLAYTNESRGTHLHAVLHHEARTILEHAAHMAYHPHLAHVHWLAQSIAHINDAGIFYTKDRSYLAAMSCFDWCWAALSTMSSLISGTVDGARDGIHASLHTLTHPLEVVTDFAHSIALLGKYTAQLFMQATLIHHPIADRIRAHKLCNDAQSLQVLANALYHEACSLTAYGATRMLSATLVEQVATGKLLHGIAVCIKHVARYTTYLRSKPPLLPPQVLPIARAMPHGYQEATQDGIELYLSFLDWAGDNPRKAMPKLRGYISKSQYALHCERIKTRALPELIEIARKLELNISPDRIAHVIWGELETAALNGCHTASGLKLHRLESKFVKILPGGAYAIKVKRGTKRVDKTMFPQSFSPHDVLAAIVEAAKQPIFKSQMPGKRFRIVGTTKNGLLLECIFESDNSLVTGFPIDKERLQRIKDGISAS